MLDTNQAYSTIVIEVMTTDGKMYVAFMDDNEYNCIHVFVQIGKNGTNSRAWTEALQELINSLLGNGIMIDDIVPMIEDITTDKLVITGNIKDVKTNIMSGPAGIVYAIRKYIEARDRSNKPPFMMPWA